MTIPEIVFDKRQLIELDCYCCNRDEHFEPVIQFLEDNQTENHLHVFIPSYAYDAPESFVTRVVHLTFPVNNFYTPSIRSGESTSSIKLVETPIELVNKALKKIEDDINTYSTPRYPENIALFYRLHLKNWKSIHCQEFITYIGSKKLPSIPGKRIRIFYWLDLTDCKLSTGILDLVFGKYKNQLERVHFKLSLKQLEQLDVV